MSPATSLKYGSVEKKLKIAKPAEGGFQYSDTRKAPFQSSRQATEQVIGIIECAFPLGRYAIELLGAATPLGCRLARPRLYESFVLEAIETCVNRAHCNVLA